MAMCGSIPRQACSEGQITELEEQIAERCVDYSGRRGGLSLCGGLRAGQVRAPGGRRTGPWPSPTPPCQEDTPDA